MVYAPPKSRLPWEDRFRMPSVGDLRTHYNKQLGNLLDLAREALLGFEGVKEQIAWQGVAWRWTLTYCRPTGGERPWAYLIPHPEGPTIAIPLAEDVVAAIPRRRLKKFVTDGIASARRVGDVYWATWQITNRSNLDDVLDLAKRAQKLDGAQA